MLFGSSVPLLLWNIATVQSSSLCAHSGAKPLHVGIPIARDGIKNAEPERMRRIERMQEQRPVARQGIARGARGGNREHAEGTESTRRTALRVEQLAQVHPSSPS